MAITAVFTDVLPEAQVVPADHVQHDQDYAHFRNVPVFVEHETTARDGRSLKFGRKELAQVADRCNRRIQDSGDYAAVVIGHTPEKADDQAGEKTAKAVGLAGPFRLGRLNDKYAILADFHIRKQNVPLLKDYPRRSPELWLADDYAEMFFDPISLLGAEAPRLDMGLLYSRRRATDGRVVETYSASMPGAMNVFVPATTDVRPDKKKDYAAAAKPAQSPSTRKAPMALQDDDVRQIVDALEALDWVQWVKSQMAKGDEEPHAEPDGDEGMPPDDDTPPELPLDDEQAPPPPPAPEEAPAPGPSDAMAEGQPEKMMGKRCYGADEAVGVAQAVVPTEDPREDDKDDPTVKYSKIFHEVSALRTRLDATERALDKERSLRINAERFAKLNDLANTHEVDAAEELERCGYGKMSDAQFDAHAKLISEKYARRIPTGTAFLPTSFNQPPPKAEKEKYSEKHAEQALQACLRMRREGKAPNYMDVLDRVSKGEQV